MRKVFIPFVALLISTVGWAQTGPQVVDVAQQFGNRTMFDAWFLENDGMTLDEMPDSVRNYCYTLLDMGAGRIAAMDSAGISYAHLMLNTPGAEYYGPAMGKQIAHEANDSVAQAIAQYPSRLGGWMTLYPEDVQWSLAEIDRCVNMGLYGWAALSNMKGKRLDDPKYWPILAKLDSLGMPVYIQPVESHSADLTSFGYCINGPAFGYGADVQTTFMRMLCRGLFDTYPNLKIILGHNGEGFPFYKDRINTAYRQGQDKTMSIIAEYVHEPSYYLEHNLWVTTSGSFSNGALRCCVNAMPAGRVMFSTDYPYENAPASVSFIRDNQILSDSTKTALLSGNATTLGFGPQAPTVQKR